MNQCNVCGSRKIRIGTTKTTSGSTIYPYYCDECGKVFTQYANKKMANEYAINNGELKYVKTATAKLIEVGKIKQNKCEVCENDGVEKHHWAPYHLFGDESEQWPTSYLCRECHKKWHNVVTPNMKHHGQ